MTNLSRNQVARTFERSLGAALVQERLRLNMDLLEVCQQTKIPAYQLSLIEKGQIGHVWDCYKLAAFYGKQIKAELVD